MNPVETALSFVKAINSHDTKRIISLMSHDHTFIDCWGNREDKMQMEIGWPGYFEWFPDYLIELEQVMVENDTVALFGFASGTYRGKTTPDDDNHWRLPAAWKAVVADKKIHIWQVYCDAKVPYDIMNGGNK